MAIYNKTDYKKAYNDIYNEQKKAAEAEYKANINELTAQKDELKKAYDEKRANSYIQARLAAKGNEETAAANGLQRGTGAATSGYTDVMRTAANNNIKSNINRLNVQEQRSADELSRQIIAAGYTKDANVARALADIKLKQLNSQQSENQYAASAEADQRNTRYANALNKAQLLGYVATDEDAAILGVKKGTRIR